jgi:hypothetical protein
MNRRSLMYLKNQIGLIHLKYLLYRFNQKFLMNRHYPRLRKNLINQKNLLSPKKQMNQNFLIGPIYLKYLLYRLNLRYQKNLHYLH